VLERNAGFEREKLRREMLAVADAGRAEAQRRRFRERDQLLHRFCRHRRIDREEVSRALYVVGDRREIAFGVVRERFVQARVHRKRERRAEQRVPVGPRFRDDVVTDDPAHAAAVVDDNRVWKLLLELPHEDARERVDVAAGWYAHHEANGACRVGSARLRVSRARARERARGGGDANETVHVTPRFCRYWNGVGVLPG
jgi:hypothetical protein